MTKRQIIGYDQQVGKPLRTGESQIHGDIDQAGNGLQSTGRKNE
jgi:hypothetical protein